MQNSTLKSTIWWVTIAALFIIPLIPILPTVAIANTYFFPFITGKNFAFRILVEIAFAGWALLALVDKKYRPKFSWIGAIFVAFVAWMAIVDSLAVNPAKAFWSNFERMDGWVTLIHLLMLFIVMGSIFTVDTLWRKWWLTFLTVAAIICAYSFMQVAGLFAIHQGGVRLDATFGNSDYLACYMLFAIAISVWQAFETKKMWLRYSLAVLTLLEISVLFLTATRGAILGFIGAIIFGSVLWMIESGKKGRRYAATILAVLIVICAGFFFIRNTPVIQHDPTLSRLATISLADPETHARFTIWHMALEGFSQKPITGWGQEGFNYVFNKYYEPQLYSQEPWFDRAHNLFLDWLIAGGIPALLLFLALFGSAAFALYKSTVSRVERITLLSALAAYAFQGFFIFDNLFSYIPLVAVFAIAHAASARPIKKLEEASVVPSDLFGIYALPFGVILLVLVIWFVNVPSMRAASDLITAITSSSEVTQNVAEFKVAYADNSFAFQEITEQLISFTEGIVADQGISSADKQTVFAYTVQQTQELTKLIPNDARIRLEYALLLRSGNDYADALTQIHAAEKLSPNKQSILTEEGIEDWESGNAAAAQVAFSKAYSLDTSFTDIAAYAAAGDIITGHAVEGKALLQQKFGTTTVDQDVVMLAYYQSKDFPDLVAVWQKRVIDQGSSATSEFGLAAALADAGQIPAARAEIQKAIADHPEAATQGAAMLSQLPQ
jgi:O-antigen ligase